MLDQILYVRVDESLIKSIDIRVKVERAKKPGQYISRSDVVRELLWLELRRSEKLVERSL